jgi:hypothetical protein
MAGLWLENVNKSDIFSGRDCASKARPIIILEPGIDNIIQK